MINNSQQESPLLLLLFVFITLSLFSGCANQPSATVSSNEKTNTETQTKTTKRPFPTETLYALLTAELAGTRNQAEITLGHYLQQAQHTRDLGVTRRAVHIAQYLGAHQMAVDTAQLWAELEPQNPEPAFIIATQFLENKDLNQAFSYSLKSFTAGGHSIFQAIAAQASKKPKEEQAALLQRYNHALDDYPKDSQLLTGNALLLHYLNDNEAALKQVSKAVKADETNISAILFKASMTEKTKGPEAAASMLSKQLKKRPKNKRLRLQYAQFLSQFDLALAQKEFEHLLKQSPFDQDFIFSLALINKELGNFDDAKKHFEQVLPNKKYTSSAYFYLGMIGEKEGNNTEAINYYLRVLDGDDYLYALNSYCRLTIAESNAQRCHDHFDNERSRLPKATQLLFIIEAEVFQSLSLFKQSNKVLTRALKQYPEDLNLLYLQSMIQEQLGDIPATEIILKKIIALDNDNANALNALGYVLTDKTERHQEAYDFISRALVIEPNNASYIDSLGWALFNLNKKEEALAQLQKAMSLFPNHEIAAHLGEVLWSLGRESEAKKIWDEGFQDKADSLLIIETKKRLGVPSS